MSRIAHYKLNDNLATDVVIDETGNNNGTAQQNTEDISTVGKINGALTFNGSSDFINIDGVLASAKTALKNVAGLLVVLQVQIDELKSGG